MQTLCSDILEWYKKNPERLAARQFLILEIYEARLRAARAGEKEEDDFIGEFGFCGAPYEFMRYRDELEAQKLTHPEVEKYQKFVDAMERLWSFGCFPDQTDMDKIIYDKNLLQKHHAV